MTLETPEPTTSTESAVTETSVEQPSAPTDWQAEAEKWKTLSRKHEKNWQKLTGEVEDLRKAQMTDAEKAIAEAEGRGRQAALESIAAERAQLKLETAAAKAGVDIAPVLGVIDVSKFVTDGDVNADAIGDFVSQLSAQFAQPNEPKFPQGLGIGPQASQSKPGQLTRADMARMTPQEIAEADDKGLFDDLKAGLV